MSRSLTAALIAALFAAAAHGEGTLGQVPMRFEPNLGQLGPEHAAASYVGRGRGYALWLAKGGVEVALVPAEGEPAEIRMRFEGARPIAPEGLDRLPGFTNYLLGNDPASWRTGVPEFARIGYTGLYPGVDLGVHGLKDEIEYDLLVAPGASIERIAFSVEGTEGLSIDGEGTLRTPTCAGELRMRAPISFQELPDGRHERASRYVLRGQGRIGFEVDGIDRRYPLVIDPVLTYSSFLGGMGADAGNGIALDANGNVYVVGSTTSADFPRKNAYQGTCGSCGVGKPDAFLTVMSQNPTGYVASTFFGGSDWDEAKGVAIDADGNIVIVGGTASPDFPKQAPYQKFLKGGKDAFVIKLDAGSLLPWFMTYLGGSADDVANAVALGPSQDPVVVGSTSSDDFPTVGSLQSQKGDNADAFVTRIRDDGQALVFSTFQNFSSYYYYGDEALGVAIDGQGSIYFAGYSGNTYVDGSPWVRKLDAMGTTVLYDADLGSDPSGQVRGIVVDGQGQASIAWMYLCNQCDEYPEVAKLDPSGSIAWEKIVSDCVPGSYYCYGGDARAIGLDAQGNAYLAGAHSDLPQICAAQPAFGGGQTDAFVAKIDANGIGLGYATYIGGSGDDSANAIAVLPGGQVWLTGATESSDFPLLWPLQGSYRGSTDVFVSRLTNTAPWPPKADFVGSPRVVGLDYPYAGVQFQSLSGCDVTSVTWDFGDGVTSTAFDLAHKYTSYGSYDVSITATNAYGTDTLTRPDYIAVIDAAFTVDPDQGIAPLTVSCTNETVGPAIGYLWEFGDGATSTDVSPTHTYVAIGRYTLTLHARTLAGDAIAYRWVEVSDVAPDFTATPRMGQAPLAVRFADLTQGTPTSWRWYFGDGGESTLQNPTHTYSSSGLYDVVLTVKGAGSYYQEESKNDYILVPATPPANIVTAPGPAPSAAPWVKAYNVMGERHFQTDILAYSAGGFGANVACGNLDLKGVDEILTGPGPGAVYGPQVRAFAEDSTPLAKINYYAYGTPRYGVIPEAAFLDADSYPEIVTGAGPGSVFGPHVRGFNYDGVTVTTLPGCSFFAYATLKYGVNVAPGAIEGPRDAILTGPGPGPTFGADVRGYRYGPPTVMVPNSQFMAFTTTHGARVSSANGDYDAEDEILVGIGPDPSSQACVRGFDYNGTGIQQMFSTWEATYYGALPAGGELDGFPYEEEYLFCTGPDPAAPARLHGQFYGHACGNVTDIEYLDFTPYTWMYGVHAATGYLGF